MIKVENLTKHFINQQSEILALKDVSFEIGEREFVSIIGPTGCGKSTLLNIIAGLEKSTFGKVFLDGKEIIGPGLERGVIFQESSLFPWKTVKENVELALTMKGTKGEKIKLLSSEYLKKMNLSDFANFYPKELSGGMRQRAALARILALDPSILLMDEPFGALDFQTRIIMQEELAKIWQENKKTVVFITHNIGEAVFLSDKIIVLSFRPGRVIEIIKVDFPRPRTMELKFKNEFDKLNNRIWNLLKQEILNNETI